MMRKIITKKPLTQVGLDVAGVQRHFNNGHHVQPYVAVAVPCRLVQPMLTRPHPRLGLAALLFIARYVHRCKLDAAFRGYSELEQPPCTA